MGTTRLPKDFREFLSGLNSNEVAYMVVGGYAVGHHGYPRPTLDLDVWVQKSETNAERILKALREFGFVPSDEDRRLLLMDRRILRMGRPPLRIEILTGVSGLEFSESFARRSTIEWDGLKVSLIGLEDLRRNKKASGRFKDLSDLDNLRGADAPGAGS